jgi:tetratricopeptide (TPR) repeat protein
MNYVPQFTIRLITTMLLVAVFAGAGTPAAAMSANELFEDGNRLFRDDLYWAALLRYRQASEAGMDTALLHYNTGVAHYKAGQHNRARESLEKAARSPKLAPLAHFNLGLNAYAAGEPDEALVWFRDARDQQRNPDQAPAAPGRPRLPGSRPEAERERNLRSRPVRTGWFRPGR